MSDTKPSSAPVRPGVRALPTLTQAYLVNVGFDYEGNSTEAVFPLSEVRLEQVIAWVEEALEDRDEQTMIRADYVQIVELNGDDKRSRRLVALWHNRGMPHRPEWFRDTASLARIQAGAEGRP